MKRLGVVLALALACVGMAAPAQGAKRAKAKFNARSSVEQVYVTDAKKCKSYELVDDAGHVVAARNAS